MHKQDTKRISCPTLLKTRWRWSLPCSSFTGKASPLLGLMARLTLPVVKQFFGEIPIFVVRISAVQFPWISSGILIHSQNSVHASGAAVRSTSSRSITRGALVRFSLWSHDKRWIGARRTSATEPSARATRAKQSEPRLECWVILIPFPNIACPLKGPLQPNITCPFTRQLPGKAMCLLSAKHPLRKDSFLKKCHRTLLSLQMKPEISASLTFIFCP